MFLLAPKPRTSNAIVDGTMSMQFEVDRNGKLFTIEPIPTDLLAKSFHFFTAYLTDAEATEELHMAYRTDEQVNRFHFRVVDESGKTWSLATLDQAEQDALGMKLRPLGRFLKLGGTVLHIEYNLRPVSLVDIGNVGLTPLQRPFTKDSAKLHFTLPMRQYRLQLLEEQPDVLENHIRIRFKGQDSHFGWARLLSDSGAQVTLFAMGRVDMNAVAETVHSALTRIYASEGVISNYEFMYDGYNVHSWVPDKEVR